MKIWWQVCIYGKPAYGFSSVNGIIVDAEWGWRNKTLQQIKPMLLSCGAKVYKISEQIIQ